MDIKTEDISAAVSGYLNAPADPPNVAAGAQISVSTAIDRDPEYETELRRVSQRTGIPLDSVRAFPDEVKRNERISATDFDELAREFPSTAKYLSNQSNADIAHDDIANMSLVEKTGRFFANSGKALASSVPQVNAGLWGLGQAAAEFAAPLAEPLAGAILPENPLTRIAQGMSAMRTQQEGIAKGLMPQTYGGNLEAGYYSGLQSLGAMGLMIGPAIVTGQPGLALGGLSGMTGGAAYGQARDAGKDPLNSLAFGASQAAIEYATEKIPVGRFLHDMKAGTPFYSMLMRQMAVEIPGEQVATALQDLNEWAVINTDKTFKDYLAARPDAAAQTLVATIVASGGAVTTVKAVDVATNRIANRDAQAAQAMEAGEALGQLDAAATASKLRVRAPEDFQALVREAAQDGPVQDVFISPEALNQSGVDLTELSRVSPAVAAQYQEALATGTDIRIPVDEFATHVAGTDMSAALLPLLKTDPAGMTQAEATEFMNTRADALQREVEAVLAERQGDDVFKASLGAVEQSVLEQLNTAARFTPDVNQAYAAMTANFYGAQAARLGVTPEQLQAQYPVTIQAEGFGQLNQGPTDSIDNVRTAWADTGVDGAVSERGDVITVSRIVVPEGAREQGAGTAAMQRLIDYADTAGKHVVLSPSADFGGDVARLKVFYKRFGFTENKGKNRAFSTSESMYREAADKTLYQATPVNNRGAYNIDTRTITLLKNADLSTFLHESGHFYLEVLTDLAARADAPAAIRDDMQKTLDWFGVADLATWQGMTLEQKRDYHEQWARGFEAYLFEGKAPAAELQGIFDRFRSWLMATYRSLLALNVSLSPEVRGVFGRMLATTDQIVETEAQQAYTPLFTAAEQAAMSPEEWAQYQSLGVEATQDAVQEMESRSLKDMRWLSGARGRALAALQREANERRKAMRREVEAEVMTEPLNQAKTFLKRGTDPVTGEPVTGPHKLQISALTDLYGGEGDKFALLNWEPLGYGQYGMLAEDGLHPDIVADRFGYSSGDELVRALLVQEDQRERITALTDQRMLERYGDLSDAAAISRAADEAVHNDARARFVATEVNALQKALGQRSILARAARQFAESTIARLRVRDVRPSQWTSAEARAARAADAAMKAGDIQGAATEKKRQLVNNYAARAAQEAQAEVEKGVNYMKRLSSANTQNGMRGEALIQMNALLARFDLRTSLSLRQIDAGKTQSLQDYVASESERLSAVMPDLPGFVLDENYRKHYRDMTVEEFRGLVESARQLATLARREQKMYTELRNMSFEQEADAILAAIRRARPEVFDAEGNPVPQEPSFVPSLSKSVSQLGDKFSGEFLNTETILSILEGGNFGQVQESLFGRMSGRTNWKASRMERIYADLKPVFQQWGIKEKRDYGRKGIFVPSIGTSLTRENALVAALLYGSAEGRARLENYGWGPRQMQGIVDVLDARDWKLADAIWRQFDEKLWPELKALNDRTRGKSPPKVEPLPFPTKFGEQRGGYFRLKYDTDLDERAHRFDEGAAVKELLGGSMGMAAKTNQGSSTERKDGVRMRPRLDLGVFAEAVNETVHDLGMREAVADTMRLLNDKGVQTAIKSAVGVPAYRALVTRVREVAAPPRNPAGFVEKFLSVARKNTIVTLMSGVFTAFQNIVGFVPALSRVNAGSLGLEVAKFYSPAMAERYRFAMEQSTYMRTRYQSFDRDVNDMATKLTVNGRILPDTAAMLAIMGFVDRGVSVPVWNAAFKDGMSQFANDTTRAVDYADSIVRQTQGSGRDVDLPSIMAGHGGYGQLKKLFTMFYSYFNGQLNMLVRAGAINKQLAKDNPGLAVARFTRDFALIVLLPAVLTELFNGVKGGGDDEDEEQVAKRYAKALTMYGAGMFPVVRDLASFTWSSFDKDSYNFGYKISPVQSAGEGVVKGLTSLGDLFTGEADIVDTKNMIMGASFAFGLPGKLIKDIVTGFDAWASGDAGPQAILFGPPPQGR